MLFARVTSAQQLTQTVRGKIIDKTINTPLIGANIIILESNPFIGASTDVNGNFKIEKVPVGRHTFKVSYIGYKVELLSNIEVTSGKELILNVEMEENVIEGKVAEVIAKAERDKPLNEMTTVSARNFSVEETRKYAAAVNDPARAVTSFAGVNTISDGNNNIIIRGNAPNGLLWRLEGVDIPNPNHFANIGTSGGGISILSSQLLTNSDFLTGAFPAEYGNALSGVFDLKLRKGNNEKHEYTIQAGLIGIDLATEGPFSKNKSGSYLVNYRYSTLGILDKLGVNTGEGASNFQDLSFNISLPTKRAGVFDVFGFGGLSSENTLAKKDSDSYDYSYKRYNSVFSSNTGAAGITHSISINNKTYLKSSVTGSLAQIIYSQEKLDNHYNANKTGDFNHLESKLNFTSTLNHKINSKYSFRGGIILNEFNYDLHLSKEDDSTKVYEQQINSKGTTQLFQAFEQFQFRFTEKWTLNTGVHYMLLLLNNSYAVEPRTAIKWQFTKSNSFSFGYGLHSQVQPIAIYFSDIPNIDGTISQPNKNLGLSKAHHFVFGYDHLFAHDYHLKTELYYQHLFNIPVDAINSNSFSLLNNLDASVYEPLTNKGTGNNYGLEITGEKFLSNGYYGIITTSLYRSKYKGSDDIQRNSRFNGHVTSTLTAGKEIKVSKSRTLGLNLKMIYAGGYWDTPIDMEKSQQNQTTYYNDAEAFTVQNPDYFRADIRISLKRNRKYSTGTWSLDIQNVSNNKNLFNKYYDVDRNEIVNNYQSPLIPVLSYRVEF